ncbi:MAG: hypothetical protein V4568_17275 [Pseudomonadota bacterium]
MKKGIVLATYVLFTMSTAFAESSPPSSNSPGSQPGHGGKPKGEQTQEHFEHAKSRHVEEIGKHIARLQKAQTCVQAAANFEAMHACRPKRQKPEH